MFKKNNNIQNYYILREIGSGGFATVYQAKLKTNNEIVALKTISKKGKELEKRIRQEIQIHSKLHHSSIVKFINSFEDEKNVYLVLEYCSKGTLEDYLKKNGTVSEQDAHDIINSVTRGLKYLRDKFIIHRDLTLRNILLTNCCCNFHLNVKIADFGFAAQLKNLDETKYSLLGTPNFMPPEVVFRNAQSFESDYWSLGCILYALLVGKPPFDGKGNGNVFNNVASSIPEIPDYISTQAKNLITVLLKKDPEERPHIYDFLQFDFFKKYGNGSGIFKCEADPYISNDSGAGSLSSASSHRLYQRSKCLSDSGLDSLNSYSNELPVNHGLNENDYVLKTVQPYLNLETHPNMVKIGSQKLSKNVKRSGKPSPFKHLKSKIELLPARKKDFNHSKERSVSQERLKQEMQNYYCPFSDKTETVQVENKIVCYPLSSHNENGANTFHSQDRANYEPTEKRELGYCKFDHSMFENTRNDSRISIPSCSHETQHCWEKNNCSHEMICSCQKYSPKSLSESNFSSDYQRSRREEKCVKEELKQVPTPLNTTRLLPQRYQTPKAVVSIDKKGHVILEFFRLRKKQKCISLVFNISPDGLQISLFKPKEYVIVGEEPLPFPNDLKQIQFYKLEKLPEVHWKKYIYAERFVDVAKAGTPKVTLYGNQAKCQMMENSDLHVEFYDGSGKIIKNGKKTFIQSKNENNHSIDNNNVPQNCENMWKIYKKMKEQCELLEKVLSNVQVESEINVFPASFGKKPEISFGGLKISCKENVMPQSTEQNKLNHKFNQLSCHNSSDNMSMTNSWKNSWSKKTSEGESRIQEVLPHLKKGYPKIKNGKIVAEYKDGLQLWSSKTSQEVYFYDPIKKKQIQNFHQNSELKRRVQHDLKRIMYYVLSKEENIT